MAYAVFVNASFLCLYADLTDCLYSNGLCYQCVGGNTSCNCSSGFEAVSVEDGLLSCQGIINFSLASLFVYMFSE